jgi:Allene oxide cyclase barrel like domain
MTVQNPDTVLAPAPDTAPDDAIVLRIPREVVVKVVDDVDVADPQPGQTGTFDDELYDAGGNLIGTSHGSFEIRYRRPTDDALPSYYQEDITLADGTIHAEGWADFIDVKTSQWVFYPAVGTSGRYLGKRGYRQWRMTGVRASAEARILLADD